ncbi:MAG: class I SAM-dependent methyltransferase [Acidobacteriaceae bacterium]
MTSSPSPPPNFDSLAWPYRWMEYASFGRMLEHCRFRYLAQCAQSRRALVLGDGDGRFTARLLATNHSIRVDAVDASGAMLGELRRRAAQAIPAVEGRLHTLQADIRGFAPEASGYDLVVSHFFLDCLTAAEVEALLQRVLPCLTPQARWMVSEFAVPSKGWQRLPSQVMIRWLYFAFDKLTNLQVHRIPDYAAIFIRHGWQLDAQTSFLGGLLVAEVWKRKDL